MRAFETRTDPTEAVDTVGHFSTVDAQEDRAGVRQRLIIFAKLTVAAVSMQPNHYRSAY